MNHAGAWRKQFYCHFSQNHAACTNGRCRNPRLLGVGNVADDAHIKLEEERKVGHLQENIESTNLVLTAEDMKEIDSALAEFKVHGGRMNQEQMKVVEQ